MCRVVEIGMARRDFNVREFPQVRVANAGGPLADEETTALLRDKGGEPLGRHARPGAKAWELLHAALLMSSAKRHQGTKVAFGLSGCTYQRADFHQ